MRFVLNRLCAAALILAAMAAAPLDAKTPPVLRKPAPKWLDTVAPSVEILPDRTYHSSVFMISLTANKRAVFQVGINSKANFREYKNPISVTSDTAMTVYFYGEDDFGNKSALDSMRYVLDSRMPRLTVTPERGVYQNGVTVRFLTDKPCRFEYIRNPSQSLWKEIPDSVEVTGVFEGFVAAIDSCGNRAVSGRLKYVVDTATFQVFCTPSGGTFTRSTRITMGGPIGVKLFYSFDPIAPPDLFQPYTAPVEIPGGLSILRYFGRNPVGRKSAIERERFLLDTVPPKVRLAVSLGSEFDTLRLSMKKQGVICYTLDGSMPTRKSSQFAVDSAGTDMSRGLVIVVPHQGMALLRAIAWDIAGNESNIVEWERKYDFVAPEVTILPPGGKYNKALQVTFATNEWASVFYTLDGSQPTRRSMLFDKRGIAVSRDGTTVIRCFAVDEADNMSAERSVTYVLDMRPPYVRAQIDGSLQKTNFTVRLTASEPSTIYYELDGANPGRQSPVYTTPIPILGGQVLKYQAFDDAGNASELYVMDELKKPMISALPEGGLYNRKIAVRFLTNVKGTVFARLFPDTAFKPVGDSIMLAAEGAHSLEYYLESAQGGLRSPLRRNEYYIDWSAPKVQVSVRKGTADSLSLFFEANENATIYYTLDGSNPFFSQKTFTAGNKFSMSSDRVSVPRSDNVKLAFFAEDAFGNQGGLTVFDVMKPRVVPDIPYGVDRVYDRIISVSLNSSENSSIFYCRHSRRPTIDSTLFTTPITLLSSDTIIAFAVDAAGFRGDLDTFVYRIDLPPSPHFDVVPDTLYSGTPVTFDGSTSRDKESSQSELQFQWDFDGDGTFDTPAGAYARVSRAYAAPGKYRPLLAVTDGRRRTGTVSRTVMVRDRCPAGMVSVADSGGRSLCIDKYEYPNEAGTLPQNSVSWVEAKITCMDAGKRLCTRQEWQSACQGTSKNVYPYGEVYEPRRCPTAGKKVWNSQSFERCENAGVYDMLGNVWEWVEDRRGDYPLMMGGSFRQGKDAHCGLQIPSTLSSKVNDAGFRCCK